MHPVSPITECRFPTEPRREACAPPINTFTLGPLPFDRYLEKVNAQDRVELSKRPALIAGACHVVARLERACDYRGVLGTVLDVRG